jgi:hypothetical protein
VKRRNEISEETNKAFDAYKSTIATARDKELYEADLVVRARYREVTAQVTELSHANRNKEAFALLLKDVEPPTYAYTKALHGEHLAYNRENAVKTGASIDHTVGTSHQYHHCEHSCRCRPCRLHRLRQHPRHESRAQPHRRSA